MKEKIVKIWPFFLVISFVAIVYGVISSQAAPVFDVSSFSPASGGALVASTTNLTMTFNSNPVAATGNIYVKRSSDHSIFATIPANSSAVIINGLDVVVDLPQNLENNNFYYIEIDGNAFWDGASEYYLGISSSTQWFFHVEDRAYGLGIVKNINTFGQGSMSSSNYFGMVASTTFFFANSESGNYLYKSDGTDSGTTLALDSNGDRMLFQTIWSSSNSGHFYSWNNILYFSADTAASGVELWRTDGTPSGTYMLKDINTGSGGSDPNSFIEANGALLFIANDGVNGSELWKTDGTTDGTVLVKNINASSNSSITKFTVMGSYVYFSANDGTNGLELWRSNGLTASTTMIRDVYVGSSGSEPFNLTPMNGYLYFGAYSSGGSSALWRTDGSFSGTTQISNVDLWSCSNQNECPMMIAWNNYLYFSGSINGSYNNWEVWRSDGTGAGTALFKDVNLVTGTANSFPRNFNVVEDGLGGSTLYFSAATATSGREIWKSDGTAGGTVMVRDSDGLSSEVIFSFAKSFNHKLYYFVRYGSGKGGLWMTDGTASGTIAVKNSTLYSSYRLFELDDKLYFVFDDGYNGSGLEPWVSDGTIEGTQPIKNIKSGDGRSMIYDMNEFTVVGDELYFLPYGSTSNAEMWKSDGSEDGTIPLPGSSTGKVVSGINLGVYDGRVYFSNNGLWRVTDDETGVEQITTSQTVSSLVEMNGLLYFSAATTTGPYAYLWQSDGTTIGTGVVTSTDARSPQYLASMNNILYFSAKSPSDSQAELFRSDGTRSGTYLVKNINPSGASSPANITTLGSLIIFSATTAINGRELWKSDGTSGGTVLLSDVIPGATSSDPLFIRKIGNNVCFLAFNDSNTVDLWRTDGTDVVKVAGDLGDPTNFRSESALGGEVIDNIYYFITYTSSNDLYHIYRSDLTATGTRKLADLKGDDWYGLSIDREVLFFKYQDSTYVSMGEDDGNNQLWKVGDSATSTYEVLDTNPHRYTYQANKQAAVVGQNIVLPYFDDFYGGEPYYYYPISSPTILTASSSNVSVSAVTLNGSALSNGRSESVVRGFVWATTTAPTRANREVNESGSLATGTYALALSALSCGTEYHYRAFVENKAGVSYGNEESFRTATCTCPTISHAITYNSYPSCTPASCDSGYHVSGSACEADSSGGGSSGSGGGGVSTPSVDSSLTVTPSQSGNITKTFSSSNSVQVIVPQNSVDSATTFKVIESSLTTNNQPLQKSGALLVGRQAFNISAVSASGQSVTSFKNSLTITIKVADLPATTTNLGVYYFDEKTDGWVAVPGAVFDYASKKVTFTSNHLTLFAIFSFLDIAPILAIETTKDEIAPTTLVTPVITEAENIVNRYYPLIDVKLEKQFSSKVATLRNFNYLSDTEKDAIVKLVAYGTPSTKILGAGERLGVVNSYLSAFGRLPKTAADFSDVIKISTGHWPTAISLEAIANAKLSFKKIYLREPNMDQPNDNAAVTITAYGLRSANRNMNSEKAAIKIYKGIFKKAPTSATDWDTVRTIAYSGAKR